MYSKVWDDQPATNADGSRAGTIKDGVVAKGEFVFHIDASAKQMEASVPWYAVKINGNNQIISSEQVEAKNYTGTAVDAEFKYDHIIKGWDYTAQSNSSKLMLENIVFMGTFIPEIVQKWVSAQFLGSSISNGAGTMLFEAAGTNATMSDVPEQSTKVAKNKIEYRDNWQRVGRLTWVSNVTVDGVEDQMFYQVHAGDSIDKVRDFERPKGGEVRGIAVIGGYIYPAGEDIVHDPTFEAGAFQLNIVGEINPVVVLLLLIAVVAVCGISMVTVVALRRRSREKNDKYQYQVPPGYRRP
jgi:hypothetical protein